MSKFEKDLSKGSVVQQLFAFSMPFLLSNIIQALYNTADMIIVGQANGTASMTGVSIGGQVTLIVTNLVIGLSMGATVLIGQYKGRHDREGMKETISTLFSSLSFLAVILTIVMILLRKPVLRFINTPDSAFDEAESYLLTTMLGIIFIFGYNALSAVMRGMGDSKRPLIFVGMACFVNIGLDILLVIVFHLGAVGAAAATVFSQALSMFLCITYLKRNGFIFSFYRSSFRFYKERLKLLLKIGIPSSVQSIVVSLSFLFLTALVNTMGEAASAALGAVGKYNGFGILPSIAMSAAIAAMVAQNMGAGEEKRAVKTMQTGFCIAMVISACIFVVTQLFPEEILLMFADDESMLIQGIPYLKVFSLDYLAVPFHFALAGLFIGSGHTTFTLINSMISSLIARVPIAYIMGVTLDLGMEGVGWAAFLATVLSIVFSVIFYFSGKWKKQVIHH
ncbi:MAG TPA: MATE family efflux transporter [Clostridiales bacterium]|nr:MATE family efflux transporter [Clostridiales bacterium]HCG36735.1 MATE family efflux transporter [Clostridiales bacterium]